MWLLPRTLSFFLVVSPLVAACAGSGSPCRPQGERLASVRYPVRDLVAADGYLYWLDPEFATENSVRGVLMRLPADGGTPQRLAASDAAEALLRNNVVVAGGAAYWLDPCPTPAPTCTRILTVPLSGGAPRVLAEGRIFAFTVHGEDLFYTLSDEWGLQQGAPDGEVRRMPAAGGESSLVLSDLVHLREVLADEQRLYLSVATSAPEDRHRRAYVLAVSRADHSVSTLVDESGTGGARPGAFALFGGYLYFSYFSRVHRVPVTGGAVEDLGDPGERSLSDLTVGQGNVLVADWGEWEGTTDDDPGVYRCGAIRMLPAGGSAWTVLAGGQESPSAVATLPGWAYWATEGYADRHDGGIYRVALPE